jgi:hypothetical protein
MLNLVTANNTSTTIPPSIQTLRPMANSVYKIHTKADLVQYLHKCCFSPASSAWLRAIKAGFFTTWPGLDEQLVRKRLPKSDATIKGHLKQQYKNRMIYFHQPTSRCRHLSKRHDDRQQGPNLHNLRQSHPSHGPNLYRSNRQIFNYFKSRIQIYYGLI